MSLWYVVFLALLQALTEFLPVSSSGHLGLAGFFLDMPYQGLTFDLALHFGTLCAVVIYFWRDLVTIAKETLAIRNPQRLNPTQVVGIGIAIATIPAAIVGASMPDSFTESLRSPTLIAVNLIVFGVLMWIADATGRKTREVEDVGLGRAFTIGLSQALALIPGTSRSGVTMTAGLALGLTREAAARYSFLMSVPIVALAALHGAYEFAKGGETVNATELGLGLTVSAVAGVGVIHLLLAILRRVGTAPFALYRIALGATVLALVAAKGAH